MTPAPGVDGALKRYRVMAYVTGSFLLVVFLGLVRYLPGINASQSLDTALGYVAQMHGLIYIVYLVVSFMLWAKMRWTYPKLLLIALGGVIPLLSFFLERRVSREVAASLDA